jgi:hypothetical protein
MDELEFGEQRCREVSHCKGLVSERARGDDARHARISLQPLKGVDGDDIDRADLTLAYTA